MAHRFAATTSLPILVEIYSAWWSQCRAGTHVLSPKTSDICRISGTVWGLCSRFPTERSKEVKKGPDKMTLSEQPLCNKSHIPSLFQIFFKKSMTNHDGFLVRFFCLTTMVGPYSKIGTLCWYIKKSQIPEAFSFVLLFCPVCVVVGFFFVFCFLLCLHSRVEYRGIIISGGKMILNWCRRKNSESGSNSGNNY